MKFVLIVVFVVQGHSSVMTKRTYYETMEQCVKVKQLVVKESRQAPTFKLLSAHCEPAKG